MNSLLSVQPMRETDAQIIAEAFAAIGWERHKPLSQYRRYYDEQTSGVREVLIAWHNVRFAGYLTLVWESAYEPFRQQGIPEVVDFNVLPVERRQGVGRALMDAVETLAQTRSREIGLGVGLYPDYGPAQRLYVQRGYIPDGRGLTYDRNVLAPMATVKNDDSLALYLTKRI